MGIRGPFRRGITDCLGLVLARGICKLASRVMVQVMLGVIKPRRSIVLYGVRIWRLSLLWFSPE